MLPFTEEHSRARWCQVLGQAERVPIQHYRPVEIRLPGLGERQVYFLEMEMLTDPELQILAGLLAKRFDLHADHVRLEMQQTGVPILAEIRRAGYGIQETPEGFELVPVE